MQSEGRFNHTLISQYEEEFKGTVCGMLTALKKLPNVTLSSPLGSLGERFEQKNNVFTVKK